MQGGHHVAHRLIKTTCPRKSRSRTDLPLTSWRIKSGAGLPWLAEGSAANSDGTPRPSHQKPNRLAEMRARPAARLNSGPKFDLEMRCARSVCSLSPSGAGQGGGLPHSASSTRNVVVMLAAFFSIPATEQYWSRKAQWRARWPWDQHRARAPHIRV